MEQKPTRHNKHSIFKLLPKVVSSVSFQNPSQFSPGRDHNASKSRTKGAIVSIVPVEARRKSSRACLYQPQEEPKSPKISCMGQIQQLKEKQKTKKENNNNNKKKLEKQTSTLLFPKKVHVSKIKRMFSLKLKGEKKSQVLDRAPSLTKMKRFASGRNHSIANFDWTAAEESGVRDSYKSRHRDREVHNQQDEEEEEEEEEVIIPFSAPITVVNGIAIRPKKEINLWKRRTMNPPRPLDLD